MSIHDCQAVTNVLAQGVDDEMDQQLHDPLFFKSSRRIKSVEVGHATLVRCTSSTVPYVAVDPSPSQDRIRIVPR